MYSQNSAIISCFSWKWFIDVLLDPELDSVLWTLSSLRSECYLAWVNVTWMHIVDWNKSNSSVIKYIIYKYVGVSLFFLGISLLLIWHRFAGFLLLPQDASFWHTHIFGDKPSNGVTSTNFANARKLMAIRFQIKYFLAAANRKWYSHVVHFVSDVLFGCIPVV